MACCVDTPTLEILAAVSILREHLPELKVRVFNVVDLMRLQSSSEHPHGMSDADYDSRFTKDKHIIFGFHGYPWLVRRLTYPRANHNRHVRGHEEEGTITTPFDRRVRARGHDPETQHGPAGIGLPRPGRHRHRGRCQHELPASIGTRRRRGHRVPVRRTGGRTGLRASERDASTSSLCAFATAVAAVVFVRTSAPGTGIRDLSR